MIQPNSISLSPIGYVHSQENTLKDTGWGTSSAIIELLPAYADGLQGLEGFSHALILTYLHQSHYEPQKHLQRYPRNDTSLPLAGIFSQRAKNRPNPIGVTAVRILSVTQSLLEVAGLDAINGTPVLDIKPYCSYFDRVEETRHPEWMDEIMKDYF